MTLNNTYVLDVDLKRQVTQRGVKFRQGDNGVLIFKVFDDGLEYSIDSATKAEIFHETSSGNVIQSECAFIQYEGKKVIYYEYEYVAMVETGINKTLLVIYENDKPVSIQPFPVIIYSDLKDGINSFIELIQDLQNQINDLVIDLEQTIKLSEKGVPNGVATLDSNGKIPISQMPPQMNTYIDHVDKTVFKDKVHGFSITDDGIAQYEFDVNSWQNVGFAKEAVGNGGLGIQLLDVDIIKEDGVLTFNYTGSPSILLQKIDYGEFDKGHFLLNGNQFSGNTYNVNKAGLYTFYYKDSNGIEYMKVFTVNISDLLEPTVDIEILDGDVTVLSNENIVVQKWYRGVRDKIFFAYNGYTLNGNTFTAPEIDYYTVYIKLANDADYTYVIYVDEVL